MKYDAKATNIFGRQSKAKIKDIVGISDVDITWKEYKEFNNVEKI